MFRTAELGRKIPKKEFHEKLPMLRAELLEIQQHLKSRKFPTIVVFSGVDAAGKSETINTLNEWMDPRWLITRAYGKPSDEMAERPEYWRYWRDLPQKGRIGLFLSCWYSQPLLDRVNERTSEAEFDEALDRVIAFENALAADGALFVKFWLHLGKEAQKKRLRALEKDPLTRWRVSQTDWDHWRLYDRFVAAAERLITRTSTGQAPWRIIEGVDKRYRSVTVGVTLRDSILKHFHRRDVMRHAAAEYRARTEGAAPAIPAEAPPDETAPDAAATPANLSATVIHIPNVSVLSRLDTEQALKKTAYANQLALIQGKLNRRFRDAKALGVSTILVFEGWDAAGKGGAIRRVTAALDARDYQVIPIAAPTDEEREHHYLWRFWRHLARAGRMTVFDRSWYGRVLVERVEGFAFEPEWKRAYAEVNDFEDQLVRHGLVLCKFWLHITKDEQLARFKAREQVEYKRWKLTEEDWRNREKWDLYEEAVNDMVERTSTTLAPWTLVEANDKRFARVKVLETVAKGLKDGLARHERSADAAPDASKPKLKRTG